MRHRFAWPILMMAIALLCCASAAAEAHTQADADIPVTSLAFASRTYKLQPHDALDMDVRLVVSPHDATDRAVLWSSSNAAVASVDEHGQLTVNRDGSATISATLAANANIRAVCTVKITAKRVKSVAISPASAVLDPGESVQLEAKLKPSNASYREVEWETDNPDVADIDADGVLRAHAPGKAVITAWTDVRRASKKLTVHVRGGEMKSVLLSAIGDVVLGGERRRVPKGDGPIRDGMSSFDRFKKLYERHGEDYFFSMTSGIFRGDDITVANLECQITDATRAAPKAYRLSGPPKYRTILSGAGIDVVCMANNHLSDFYARGNKDTIRNMQAVGIAAYGVGSGNIAVRDVNGVRIGFAGFVTPSVSRNDVLKAVRVLKRNRGCDVAVVSFHWAASPEWTSGIRPGERTLARFAIVAGADLVLGHHKHLPSGVERYRGKMIVYDLGNFLALLRHRTAGGGYVSKDAFVFQQRFNVFEDGYVECADPNFIPCLNSESQQTFTGQPRAVSGGDAQRILDKIRARTPTASRSLVANRPAYRRLG